VERSCGFEVRFVKTQDCNRPDAWQKCEGMRSGLTCESRRRSGNCQPIGSAPGGSRARSGERSERTLDAPKRSRRIEHRSDVERAAQFGPGIRSISRRHSGSFPTVVFQENGNVFTHVSGHHQTRAPAHHRHRHLGRGRPRRQARGHSCDAEAGSLTPHFCSDSCAGALSGRHKTPPGHFERSAAKTMQSSDLRRRR
jgi:hypothetical protein